MTFDLDDLMRSLNPGTALSVAIGGFAIGAYLLARWAVYPHHVLWLVAVMGTVWTTMLMAVRVMQASPNWEAYLGAVILWWVYCLAMWIGLRWRE